MAEEPNTKPDTDSDGATAAPSWWSARRRTDRHMSVGSNGAGEPNEDPSQLVAQPAKVMRIGSMIKQLLEEVRSSPLDEAGRQRLTEIHRRSIVELEDGLAPELVEELERLSLPFEPRPRAERGRTAHRTGSARRLA